MSRDRVEVKPVITKVERFLQGAAEKPEIAEGLPYASTEIEGDLTHLRLLAGRQKKARELSVTLTAMVHDEVRRLSGKIDANVSVTRARHGKNAAEVAILGGKVRKNRNRTAAGARNSAGTPGSAPSAERVA